VGVAGTAVGATALGLAPLAFAEVGFAAVGAAAVGFAAVGAAGVGVPAMTVGGAMLEPPVAGTAVGVATDADPHAATMTRTPRMASDDLAALCDCTEQPPVFQPTSHRRSTRLIYEVNGLWHLLL
jgi:hypothetical protein